jgi:peptidoglycan-associated lipoprotein
MIAQRRIVVSTFVLATAIIGACSKPAPAPTPTPTAAPAIDSAAIRDSIERARLARLRQDSINQAESSRRRRQQQIDDSIANARTMAEAAERDAAAMRSTITTLVNYDFDKAELRADTKAALDQKIPILMANPALAIRVAGHTDSRGSGEYNLQLGQRRAAAARDYLTARGVASSRIELVSYGEDRPLCQGQDESCWSQNRRAEFEITAGGSPLKKP